MAARPYSGLLERRPSLVEGRGQEQDAMDSDAESQSSFGGVGSESGSEDIDIDEQELTISSEDEGANEYDVPTAVPWAIRAGSGAGSGMIGLGFPPMHQFQHQQGGGFGLGEESHFSLPGTHQNQLLAYRLPTPPSSRASSPLSRCSSTVSSTSSCSYTSKSSLPIDPSIIAALSLNPTDQKPPASSTARRTLRALARDPCYIPRPRNAFILFRTWYVETRKASPPASSRPGATHVHGLARDKETGEVKTLSKEASEAWKKLSGEEREVWKRLADEEREEHKKRFPGYKYKPRRNVQVGGEKEKGRAGGDGDAAASESEGEAYASDASSASRARRRNQMQQMSSPMSRAPLSTAASSVNANLPMNQQPIFAYAGIPCISQQYQPYLIPSTYSLLSKSSTPSLRRFASSPVAPVTVPQAYSDNSISELSLSKSCPPAFAFPDENPAEMQQDGLGLGTSLAEINFSSFQSPTNFVFPPESSSSSATASTISTVSSTSLSSRPSMDFMHQGQEHLAGPEYIYNNNFAGADANADAATSFHELIRDFTNEPLSLSDIDLSYQLISPTSIFYPPSQLLSALQESDTSAATDVDTRLRPLDAISTSLLSHSPSSSTSLGMPSGSNYRLTQSSSPLETSLQDLTLEQMRQMTGLATPSPSDSVLGNDENGREHESELDAYNLGLGRYHITPGSGMAS